MAYPKGGKTANTPHPRQLHGTVAADIKSDVSTEREFKRPVPSTHGVKSVEMINVCDLEDFDHVVRDYIKHSSSPLGEFPIMSYPDSRCSVETSLPASKRVQIRKMRKRAFTIPKRWTGGDEVTEYHEFPARRKKKVVAPFYHSTHHLSVPFFDRKVNVMYGSILTELTCLDLFSSDTEQFFLVDGVMKSLSELHGEFHVLMECGVPFPLLHYIVKKQWKVITPFSVYEEWAPADKQFARDWFSRHTYELEDTTFRRSRYPYEMYVSSIKFDEVELDVRVIGGSARAHIDVDAGDFDQMAHFQLMLGNAPPFKSEDPRQFTHPYSTDAKIDISATSMCFRPRMDWQPITAPYTPANLKWLFGLKHRKLAILLTTVDISTLNPVRMAMVYCYARSYPERFTSVVSQSPFAAKYLHGVFPNQTAWIPFSWEEFESIAGKTFNGHSKKYVLTKESVFTMLYSCGLCFSSAPHDWRMLEKELNDLPTDTGDFCKAPSTKPVHPSRLRVRSQLNGANGEVTGLDDMKNKGKKPAHKPKQSPKKHAKPHTQKAEVKKLKRQIKKHSSGEGRVTKSDRVYSQVMAGMDTKRVKASGHLLNIQLDGTSGQVLFDQRISVPVLAAAQGDNGNLANEMRNYTQANLLSLKLLVHLNRIMGSDEEIVVMSLNTENRASNLIELYEIRQREPSTAIIKPSNFQVRSRGGVNQYMSTVNISLVHSTRYIWGSHDKDVCRLVIFVYQRANVVPLAAPATSSQTAVVAAEGLQAPAGKIMFLSEVELIEKTLPNQSDEFFTEPERGPVETMMAKGTSSAPYATTYTASEPVLILMSPSEATAAANTFAEQQESGSSSTPSVDVDGGDVTHETFQTAATVLTGLEVFSAAVGFPEIGAILMGVEVAIGFLDKLIGTNVTASEKSRALDAANNVAPNGTPNDLTSGRQFFSSSIVPINPGQGNSRPSPTPYWHEWLSQTTGVLSTVTSVMDQLFTWGFFPVLINAASPPSNPTDTAYIMSEEAAYNVFMKDGPSGLETLMVDPITLASGATITSAGPYLGQPVLRRAGPNLSNLSPRVLGTSQYVTPYYGRKFCLFLYDTAGDVNSVMAYPLKYNPDDGFFSGVWQAGTTPTIGQVSSFFGCNYSTDPTKTAYTLHIRFTYRKLMTLTTLQESIIASDGLVSSDWSKISSSGERKSYSGLAETSMYLDLSAGVDFASLIGVPFFDKRMIQQRMPRLTPTTSPKLWNEADDLYTAVYEIRTDF